MTGCINPETIRYDHVPPDLPISWTRSLVAGVGGLAHVGFGSGRDLLLVGSPGYLSIYDMLSGRRLARDGDLGSQKQNQSLVAPGFDVLRGELIPMAGIRSGACAAAPLTASIYPSKRRTGPTKASYSNALTRAKGTHALVGARSFWVTRSRHFRPTGCPIPIRASLSRPRPNSISIRGAHDLSGDLAMGDRVTTVR